LIIENVLRPCWPGIHSSDVAGDTMLKWYQRRTQKGMGRIEKITLTGVTKNPRLLKACNTTAAMCDMGEFFFISLMNEIDQIFNYTKKNIFLNVGQFFWVNF